MLGGTSRTIQLVWHKELNATTNHHMAWVILCRFMEVLTLVIMGILFKVLVFNLFAKIRSIDNPQWRQSAKQWAMVWKNYFAVATTHN